MDLKQRGIHQTLLFVTNGLVGPYYPKAKIQQCLVHVSRTISHHVRVSDRQAVMNDFKLTTDMKAAKRSLEGFIECWEKRYPRITNKLKRQSNLLTCFDFPDAIRASIYSTNLIESFSKKLKRQTKKREKFPNEESPERALVSVIMDYNDKFEQHVHKVFNQVEDTLDAMF